MIAHPEDHRKFFLSDLINANGFTRGAEIGVHEGITYRHLLNKCPQLTLYGIDLWQHEKHNNKFEIFYTDLISLFKDDSRSILIRESSFTAHQKIDDNSLDFIFIDADHRYTSVKKDISNWMPKIRKNGYICGHDINQRNVKRAVTEMIGNDYLIGPDNVWYKKIGVKYG